MKILHSRALCVLCIFPALTISMDCSGKQTAMDIVKGLDLSAKTFVITGGDSGLGYEIALTLASAKAKVLMACRSKTKCPAAASNITKATGNSKVIVVPADLSSFASVRSAAATLLKEPRIDVLINNAGLISNPSTLPAKTDDGFDRVYQVNVLSHHLLVHELLPLLRSSGARVVDVASVASEFACLWGRYPGNCTDLENLPAWAKTSPTGMSWVGSAASNYGMTKYLEVFLAAELAKREPNMTAFSLHPGVVATDMTDTLPWIVRRTWCATDGQTPCPRDVHEGAATPVYVAVASKEELAAANGRYFDSCKVYQSVRDKYAKDHGEAAALTYQSGVYDMADRLLGLSDAAHSQSDDVVV